MVGDRGVSRLRAGTWSRSPGSVASRGEQAESVRSPLVAGPPPSPGWRGAYQRPMAIQGFSHVGVCVTDLEVSTRFYCDVLGFRELFTVTMGDEVAATMEQAPGLRFTSRMLARPDVRIELLHWEEPAATGDGRRRSMTDRGMTHLCIRVDDVDDLASAAVAAGGAVHPETRSVLPGAGDGGADVTLLYLTDPDGTRIECMAGTPDLSQFFPAPDR